MQIRSMAMAATVLFMTVMPAALPTALAQQDPADQPSDSGGQPSSSQQQPAVVVIAATPPTQIEAFEQTPGAIIIKRFTKVATVASDDGGTINLYAVALQNSTNDSRLNGVAVELVQRGGRAARAYIDPGEIGPLIDALADLQKIDRGEGSLEGVEGRYTTHGHLQFVNVDDGGSRAVVIHVLQVAPITGQVSTATVRVRAGRLAEVRQQVTSARDALDRAAAK